MIDIRVAHERRERRAECERRLEVKITNIDEQGKIYLIRPELEDKVAPREPRAPRPTIACPAATERITQM
ncbi:hypothetical protein M1R55_04800 [Deinococcus sp. QL22]|nr:hypothetical protein [Deinococcus sp. QL22]UQN07229.1 hypothetical protein M1R55_04800 [Deinococcus sp. QL22]